MIDWNKFSNYLTLDENTDYYLVLKNWRQHEKEYNGRVKNVLSFDVVEINGEKVDYPVVFSVSGGNAQRFRPSVVRALEENRNYVYVCINRGTDKKINIADMKLVKNIIDKQR